MRISDWSSDVCSSDLEGEQGLAVALRRIGGFDAGAVVGFERAALRLLQRVEQGFQRAALDVFGDRVLALQHLEILRLPDIEMLHPRSQQVVVEGRLFRRLDAQRRLQSLAPAAFAHRGVDRLMRGRAEVARNLAGEETARGDIADQPWEQLLVAEQPVQRGIGEQQIDRGRRAPVRDVRLLPLHIGRLAAGMGEHFRRVVDARDLGIRPTVAQRLGHVAAAAAEVDDGLGVLQRDVLDQVERGPQPLPREGEVLMRVRSEEHTSELQSLMRFSYAVFCLKKKKNVKQTKYKDNNVKIHDCTTRYKETGIT